MTHNPSSRAVGDVARQHDVTEREALRGVVDAKHVARYDGTDPLHLPASVLPRVETRPH